MLKNILLFTAFIFSSLHAQANIEFLKNDHLRTVASIFSLQEGALLHQCGFMRVQEFTNHLNRKDLRQAILNALQKENPQIRSLKETSHTPDITRISEISMGPGYPVGLEENLLTYLFKAIESELSEWMKENSMYNLIFEGSALTNEENANDVIGFFDQLSRQLLVINIDAGENCQ